MSSVVFLESDPLCRDASHFELFDPLVGVVAFELRLLKDRGSIFHVRVVVAALLIHRMGVLGHEAPTLHFSVLLLNSLLIGQRVDEGAAVASLSDECSLWIGTTGVGQALEAQIGAHLG